MIVAGFLLYCALSSIGGAMAGKPEDLSVTNVLFTVILVAKLLRLHLHRRDLRHDLRQAAWLVVRAVHEPSWSCPGAC